jgi:ribose transport system substrate-binding protein
MIDMGKGMLRWCGAVAMVLFIAGCGSSSSSSSSSSGSATESANVTLAKQIATKAEQVPNTIDINTPLSKKPPTGKTILFLRCDQAVCGGYTEGLEAGAKALGWHIKYETFTQTPQGIQAAINTAIQTHPDGIFFTGQPRAEVKPLFAALEKAKIPIVSGFDENVAGEGPDIANVANYPHVESYARVMAAWLTAESGGKANAALFDVPSLPILASASVAFKKELAKLCPACKSTVVHQQLSDLGGTAIANSAVSTLQRNPDIDYLGFVFGEMVTGVPAALRAADLQNQAQIFVYSSTGPPNLVEISKGEEKANTAFSIPYFSWRALDAFARHFVGDSPAIDTSAALPGQILNKGNVVLGTNWAFAQDPNMSTKFEELWHVR